MRIQMSRTITIDIELNYIELLSNIGKYPFFIVTENNIKVTSLNSPKFSGYVTFEVYPNIKIGVFEYENQLYWFWYKVKSHRRIEIKAPGLYRKKIHKRRHFDFK